MKVGGWSRLGIVISLGWMITVTSWCLCDYHADSRRDTMLVKQDYGQLKPWELYKMEKHLQNTDIFDKLAYEQTQKEIHIAQVQWLNFLTLLLIPPIIMWISGFSSAWVVSGFKQHKKSQPGR